LVNEAQKLKAKLGLEEDGEGSEVYTTALGLIRDTLGHDKYSERLRVFMEEPPLQ
jgi:hypothetical protein